MEGPRRIDPDRDDMKALLQLIRTAFASMDGVIDPPSSAHELTAESLRDKARLETGFVIMDEGLPVACLFCRPERPDTLYLGKLAVDPARQGRGLGRLLLAAADDLARAAGLRRLRLETRVELDGNHRTFERWGFVKTGESRHPGFSRTTSIDMERAVPEVP